MIDFMLSIINSFPEGRKKNRSLFVNFYFIKKCTLLRKGARSIQLFPFKKKKKFSKICTLSESHLIPESPKENRVSLNQNLQIPKKNFLYYAKKGYFNEKYIITDKSQKFDRGEKKNPT